MLMKKILVPDCLGTRRFESLRRVATAGTNQRSTTRYLCSAFWGLHVGVLLNSAKATHQHWVAVGRGVRVRAARRHGNCAGSIGAPFPEGAGECRVQFRALHLCSAALLGRNTDEPVGQPCLVQPIRR